MSGYAGPDGEPLNRYGPGDPVTYAQVVKMAILSLGLSPANDVSALKNRSAKGDWSAPFIVKAEKLGVSVLTSDLDVTKPATRGDVMRIVADLAGLRVDPRKRSDFYYDVSGVHAAAPSIIAATQAGIVSGDASSGGGITGLFRPDAAINRAEVAKVFLRLIDMEKKSQANR